MSELIPFNGRFTIKSPNGGHKTFQVKTAKGGKLKGQRILSLFIGRENTNDMQYKGFAFVTESNIHIWRSQNTKDNQVYVSMLKDMVANGENGHYGKMGYTLMLEKKCRVCNRTLTNPSSLVLGVGPECASR